MCELKLSIKINNKQPIELNQLTSSLNALANEYDLYCKNELNYTKNERKLEIIKLEKGCLLIELIQLTPAVIPLIENMNSIFCFGTYFIETLQFFSGKKEEIKYQYNKKNCENTATFLQQTANDNGSSIDINVVGNNNTIIIGEKTDSLTANAIQNKIAKYQTELLEEEPNILHKQGFYWSIASFLNKQEGKDKGIIESLDKKAHKVIFENETDKEIMTTFNDKLNKDWQDLLYIVDVEVIKIQDVIKTYKIIKVYYDDTINPNEN